MRALQVGLAVAVGAVLGFGGSALADRSDGLTPEEERAIAADVESAARTLIEAQARRDVPAILASYERSPRLVYAGVDEIRMGWEPLRITIDLWQRRHPDVQLQAEVVETRVLGPNAAVVVARGHSSDAGNMVWTRVLVRNEEGRWVVALEHEAWRQAATGSGFHELPLQLTGGSPSRD